MRAALVALLLWPAAALAQEAAPAADPDAPLATAPLSIDDLLAAPPPSTLGVPAPLALSPPPAPAGAPPTVPPPELAVTTPAPGPPPSSPLASPAPALAPRVTATLASPRAETPLTTAPQVATDDEEDGPTPDVGAPGAPVPAPPAYATVPQTPRYAPPPRPAPPRYANRQTEPVFIDQAGRTPEGAPSPWDLGYESRLRASEDAARGRQGALDGAWLLVGADGQVIYDLQIVDPGQGLILLDGAFRDRRRGSTPGASGFLTGVERDGASLRIRLRPRGASAPTLIELQPGPNGWMGQIDEPAGKQTVLMRRG